MAENGQALINKFMDIGPWLAATLPHTFGSLAHSSPPQVATLYRRFTICAIGPPLEAYSAMEPTLRLRFARQVSMSAKS